MQQRQVPLKGTFARQRFPLTLAAQSSRAWHPHVVGDLTCESIPYCRDSRAEVILDQPCFDGDEFEKPLLKCLKT
ncbi:MAG: hypothetical protein AABP62_27625 [Planctomycetota bacterium]